jgi:hypothetical protein
MMMVRQGPGGTQNRFDVAVMTLICSRLRKGRKMVFEQMANNTKIKRTFICELRPYKHATGRAHGLFYVLHATNIQLPNLSVYGGVFKVRCPCRKLSKNQEASYQARCLISYL